MVLRLLFCPIRPFFCRIRLLTLHLRHLTDRMFLARGGKQSHRKENSEDALAKERTHNALAQLSVSRRLCKAKALCRVQPSLPAVRGRGAPNHSITITSTSMGMRKSKSRRQRKSYD